MFHFSGEPDLPTFGPRTMKQCQHLHDVLMVFFQTCWIYIILDVSGRNDVFFFAFIYILPTTLTVRPSKNDAWKITVLFGGPVTFHRATSEKSSGMDFQLQSSHQWPRWKDGLDRPFGGSVVFWVLGFPWKSNHHFL